MTASPKVDRWLKLGLLLPIVVFNGWLALQVIQYFQPLVTIFVLAAVLAFVLNYPVQFLQKREIKRTYAVILVFLASLSLLIILSITLVPLLVEQFNESLLLLPKWIESGTQELKTLNNWAAVRHLPINFNHLATQLTDRLPDELQSVAENLVSLALGAVDSVSEVVLTIVLSFYFLFDGERSLDYFFKWLPPPMAIAIKKSLQQNFQNYFVAQIALACLVGVAMTTTFLLLKVPFGLVFGLAIALLTLVPFGDVLGFSLVSLLVASHDFWLGIKTILVAVVVDQIIDQAIAPRLLGSFTGLSPVGIVAALAVGTKVAGLLGLLIAVPIASCLKDVLDNWDNLAAKDPNVRQLDSKLLSKEIPS
jgi:predicted PurR-regulated permease PerM